MTDFITHINQVVYHTVYECYKYCILKYDVIKI